jgi:hypothetical protein
MAEATVFEELSRDLPEDERERLRKKINAQLAQGGTDEVLHIALQGADRTRLLNRELARVPWWVKLSLWLRSLFSVADRETLLIDQKLAVLRRSIRARDANLVIFESRVLTAEFGQELYTLYRALHPLIGLIRDFARNPKFIQEAFVFLVNAKLTDPKSSLEQFIHADEMVEVLRDGEARDLRNEVVRRINVHFDEVPGSFYTELQRGLEPLLYLRSLVLLPFASIFSNFSYTLTGLPEGETPRFTTASVALMLESAEKLHHGVYMAMRLGKAWSLHPELMTFYASTNPTDPEQASPPRVEPGAAAEVADDAALGNPLDSPDESASGVAEAPAAVAAAAASAAVAARGSQSAALEVRSPSAAGPDVARQRPSERARVVQQFTESITGVLKAAKDFSAAVPLLDIIRYFRRDPYYSLAFAVPTYYIKNIYTGATRTRVLEELDDRIGEIEGRVLRNRSEALFGGLPIEPLAYYTELLAQITAGVSASYLTHARSLTLVSNFLATVYRDRLRDPIQFLFNKVVQDDRVLHNRLGQHIAGMEELRTAIALFDRSMAPDEEAGEALSRLQIAATLTGESRRFLRQTVRAKDDEAADLVKEGNGHISGLEQVISEILSRPPTVAFASLRNAPIRKVLGRVAGTLKSGANLLDQILNYELRQGSKT